MNTEAYKSLEIEQSILGAMIIDLDAALQIKSKGIKSLDFYDDRHKVLYTDISEVLHKYSKIDLILLLEHLKSKNDIEKCGGITYITQIFDGVPSTSNIENYIDILREYRTKRELLELANYIKIHENDNTDVLKTNIHGKIMDMFNTGKNELTPYEHQEQFLITLQNRVEGIEGSQGIKTGIHNLDEIIGGFSGSELIDIFAFSGVGKTVLACQIALNMVLQSKKKTLFFTLEMTPTQLLERLACNVCTIQNGRMRKGQIDEKEFININNVIGYLCSENRLIISQKNSLSEIVAKIQLEKMKNNTDIVFIDYVGLIQAPAAERRDLAIANITGTLKRLANDLNIPIVILSQAKQSVQNKKGTSYTANEKLSDDDIAESASIFRDSDKVIGIYRNTELDDPIGRHQAEKEGKLDFKSKDATYNPQCVNLLVKKCRNGTKVTLACKWEGQFYRISNLGVV
ncbi:hypothetical protein IAI10_02625 [Clostridium sp. 19966]|uniref:replicative DNA helicase n=1 Tax=Clostridium sp. 19966 TaxID=2768166 RepID=UPI0028E01768|nr:DnaB-like helicase C-terminal domain-containing protein [Clostridium sp. 19966]MDT8715554.1 hypothetical protein [Clostridium sp. 19966]